MRVLLLALMIVLLPLRGWVGDAMAMATLVPATPPAQTASADPHSDHAAATDDLAGQDDDAGPCTEHAEGGGDGCAHCVACDVCHSAAHSPVAVPVLLALPAAAPVARNAGLPASAERAAGFKPPIS